MPRIKDLIGLRFGKLVVTSFSHVGGKKNLSYWGCNCDCGKTHIVSSKHLRGGQTQSCGCLRKENWNGIVKHGLYNTPEYQIWEKMRDRCNNPKHKQYKDYGGRGIKICKEWDNPEIFIQWLKDNNWNCNLQLDRINNEEDYSPQNCRLVTHKQNQRNKRTNLMVNYLGKNLCLVDFVEKYTKLPYKLVQSRITRLGWSLERAAFTKRK